MYVVRRRCVCVRVRASVRVFGTHSFKKILRMTWTRVHVCTQNEARNQTFFKAAFEERGLTQVTRDTHDRRDTDTRSMAGRDRHHRRHRLVYHPRHFQCPDSRRCSCLPSTADSLLDE